MEKKLPVGLEAFKVIIDGCYYGVNKTESIAELFS